MPGGSPIQLMSIPILEQLTPEFRDLIETVVSNLHFIVRQPMSREAAIEVKQLMTRPIGALNAQHGLQEGRSEQRRAKRLAKVIE